MTYHSHIALDAERFGYAGTVEYWENSPLDGRLYAKPAPVVVAEDASAGSTTSPPPDASRE